MNGSFPSFVVVFKYCGGVTLIANLETARVLDHADNLANMIITSDIFYDYTNCRQAIASDEQAQQLIHKFLIVKAKYEEVQRFGRHHPDFKPVIREMMTAKRTMDLYPPIAEFKRSEKKLMDLLAAISTEVAHSVSDSIMVPNGDPSFDRGCASNGSCHCQTGH